MVEKLPLNMIPTELKFRYLLLHKQINKIRLELENFEPTSENQNPWIKKRLHDYSKLFVEIQLINNKALKIKPQKVL